MVFDKWKSLSINKIKNDSLFMNPIAFKIDSIKGIDGEKFGPVLHFISYDPSKLDELIEEINSTGFGLTMGVHSRILEKAKQKVSRSFGRSNEQVFDLVTNRISS